MSFRKIIILSVILMITACLDIYLFMTQPMNIKETLAYEIKTGSSVSVLSKNLHNQNIISRPYYLSIYARLTGQAGKLKVGEYILNPGMSPHQLLTTIVSGKVKQYSITLVEGNTFWQMMDLINNSPYLSHNLNNLSDNEIMSRLGYANQHPEGQFYPDTYHFPKGLSDIDFLHRAYDQMQQHLNEAWQNRDIGLPFKTPYEALIMASIVEKESALASERTTIAGVFINRLRKRMRLQTDPTVIYGLGRNFDGDIRYRDLRNDTPYNTYTRKGLPPTPIAMPGIGSIEAVMHPENTDYIFFVAKGDGSGQHEFSSTLAEHEKLVDKYQRKR
ncbi:MAG: endolytic transglycosylase MltG [Gammaproteobacteria bacterium]|nr:endolytic transglycosylase MltG [Gammaproteobacteria bacterium]